MEDKFGYKLSAFIALIGVIASVGVSYWVTYEKIEKPKIEMETQKNRLAGVQIIQELRPSASVKCDSLQLEHGISWRIVCTVTNTGKYLSAFSIAEITAAAIDDKLQKIFKENDWSFKWLKSKEKGAVKLKPGESNDFSEVIEFDKSKFPNGVNGDRVKARISFDHSAWDELVTHMKLIFPEFQDLIDGSIRSGQIVEVLLNPTR